MAGSFVRVVERQGWDVEFVSEARTEKVGSRDDALALARSANPEWIEVGEVVPASEGRPQHHRWTTLRRSENGDYERSALSWGGKSG